MSDLPQSKQPRLSALAQDVGRTVLGGARRAPEGQERALPEAILTGRQLHLPNAGAENLRLEFTAGQILPLEVQKETIKAIRRTVDATFNDPALGCYKLEEDLNLPWWVYFQKCFALPTDATGGDFFLPPVAADGTTLSLPPTVLREMEVGVSRPRVTLCRMVRDDAYPTIQRAHELPAKHWLPAMCLRCSLSATWGPGAPAGDPVYELRGVPQSQRWFLDQLGLLGEGELSGELRLYIVEGAEGRRATRLDRWVLVRSNLTRLSRPGPGIAKKGEDKKVEDQPYAATGPAAARETLALIQMASITNAGGYYLRAEGAPRGAAGEPRELVIILDFGRGGPEPGEGETSRELPPGANALTYLPALGGAAGVVRFEGMEHVEIEAYAPPGCLAVGFVREMPWPAPDPGRKPSEVPPDDQLTGPHGFAESIHLVDFQVNDARGPIQEWRQPTDGGDWRPETSSADHRACLVPMDPQNRNESGLIAGPDGRAAAVRLEGWPAERAPRKREAATMHRHSYRSIVRYAYQDVYAPLAGDPSFEVIARLRDLHGNRFKPTGGELRFRRPLFYADRLIPPSEWPGFWFAVRPAAQAGSFVLSAAYMKPAQSTGEDAGTQRLRRLQLILDQLTGADDGDVNVRLVNAGDGSDLVTDTAELRSRLKDQLKVVLKDGGEKPVELDVAAFTFDVGSRNRPVRFEPVLTIERTRHADLDRRLPSDPTLSAAIRAQVTSASSAMSLEATGPDGKVRREFRETAQLFRAPKSQTAIARNRFNQHELWFVPDGILPSAVAASPKFWTARPLSNVLGTATFRTADFSQPAEGAAFPFELERDPQSFVRQDFDQLGRRLFSFVETALPPEVVTERSSEGSGARWAGVLAAKDTLAASLCANAVVRMFAGDGEEGPAVRRMALDAFRNDLRAFYRIDTFVTVPIHRASVGTGVTTFYGRASAEITSDEPYRPSFSDVVLNVDQDLADGGGSLSLSYDLPPGGEKRWQKWQTRGLSVVLTHLQQTSDQGPGAHPFDRGHWLEFVPPGDDPTPAMTLNWTVDRAVPVVLREFPAEPRLLDAIPTSASPQAEGPATELTPESFDVAARWGWKVKFGYEFAPNDRLLLSVAYNDTDPPQKVGAGPSSKTDQPFDDLLELLIVADQLAASSLWSDLAAKDRAVLALEFLLKRIATKLGKSANPKVTELPVDRFSITGAGVVQVPENPLVKAIRVVPDKDASDVYTATADHGPASPLRVVGEGFCARTFRPSLSLTRNEVLSGAAVTDALVYRCGPVVRPEPVLVTNTWRDIRVAGTAARLVADVFADIFRRMLGDGAMSAVSLRVDVKHAFKFSPDFDVRQVNPILLFPADYAYSTPDSLGQEVATRYARWLVGANSIPQALFGEIVSPAVQVGIQAAVKNADGSPGRVVLRIENIVLDTIRY